MDEVEKIKALKSGRKRGGCLSALLMVTAIALVVKGLLLYALIMQPQPEVVATPEPTNEVNRLAHQRQTAVIYTNDTTQILRVGYEYYDNTAVVTSWECGYQRAICQWYTPNVPANRDLFVIVDFVDRGTVHYKFSPALDFFDVYINEPLTVEEVLP